MRTLKKTLCLVLALVMMLGVCAFSTSAAFSDAEKITNKEAVDVLTGIGVIKGMGDAANTFNPDGTLTRAQACTIIAKLMGGDGITAKSTFTDMADAAWAESYVAFCQAKGVVGGYGDGKFGPNDTLTGSQWAKMVLTAAGVDAKENGFEAGNVNWEIGVAKTVKDKGLAARISGFNGTQSISRDAACELGFQGMKISPKGSTGYVVGGMTFPDLASAVLYNSSLEAGERGITAAPAADSLMASNFPGLKPIQAKKDAFGRTLTGWTYNAKNTGKASDDVVVYETTKAAAYALTVNALNKKGLNDNFVTGLNKAQSTKLEAADTVDYYLNSKTAAPTCPALEISDEIEVMLKDGKVSEVFIIRYSAVKVGKTTSVSSSTTAGLVGKLAEGSTSKIDFGGVKIYDKLAGKVSFKEGDYALVVIMENTDGDKYIAAAKPVTTVEGTISGISYGTTLTLGGKVYALSGITPDSSITTDLGAKYIAAGTLATASQAGSFFANTYILHLAQDGTYIAIEKKTDKEDSSIVYPVAYYEKWANVGDTTYGSGATLKYVQGVNLDGEIVTYQVKTDATEFVNKVCKVVVKSEKDASNEDAATIAFNYATLTPVDGKELGAVVDEASSKTEIKATQTGVEDDDNTFFLNADQKVIFVDGAKASLKVTVKTGKTAIKNKGYIIYGTRTALDSKNYTVKAIFVGAKPSTESTGTGLVFGSGVASGNVTTVTKADGTLETAYKHNVWIDGKEETILTDSSDAIAAVPSKYTIAEDTKLYTVTGEDLVYVNYASGTIGNNYNGIVTLGTPTTGDSKNTDIPVSYVDLRNATIVNTIPAFAADFSSNKDKIDACANTAADLKNETITIVYSVANGVYTATLVYITDCTVPTEG